jgi:putative SOS response-associated peptidase YedK
MCGRFTLKATPEALNKLFPTLFDGLELAPSYNVAPSQNVLAVRLRPGTKEPEAVQLKWGLVPSWADDPKIEYRTINARLDTAPTKPAFRSAFKSCHCLVLADGFYEWKATGGKKKQPYHIRLRDGGPFAFAGLWETWPRDGQPFESCTILTTEPNELTQQIHDRMPVIVGRDHYANWLDAARSGTLADCGYLGPYPAGEMTAVPVSTHVNSPKNNDSACLTPLASAAGL